LENGTINIDEDKCNGCGWCIEACDFGAINLNTDTKVVEICNLCTERDNGPACVEWCPEEALELTTKDIISQKARIDAVKKLLKAALGE
jgi:Fe-S-cluster-containing hydrogenase component 2